MRYDLLLVEDSAYKRTTVTEFLKEHAPESNVIEAFSFNSGSRKIGTSKFKIAILDLSLPTYDRNGPESGGRFRTLGGREIARKLIRRCGADKIIFLTQYATFSDREKSYSLDELVKELEKECGKHYVATVFYDSAQSTWKRDLLRALERALNENSTS